MSKTIILKFYQYSSLVMEIRTTEKLFPGARKIPAKYLKQVKTERDGVIIYKFTLLDIDVFEKKRRIN